MQKKLAETENNLDMIHQKDGKIIIVQMNYNLIFLDKTYLNAKSMYPAMTKQTVIAQANKKTFSILPIPAGYSAVGLINQ